MGKSDEPEVLDVTALALGLETCFAVVRAADSPPSSRPCSSNRTSDCCDQRGCPDLSHWVLGRHELFGKRFPD